MPSPNVPIPDDDFGFHELAAWSAPKLDQLLEQNGLPAATKIGDAGALARGGHLLRLSPTVAWLIVTRNASPAGGAQGVVVDLSSSRMRLRLRGAWAVAFPKLVPVDCTRLGPAFAATLIHSIPVTILKVEGGLDLFVVRSFAASLVDWLAVNVAS